MRESSEEGKNVFVKGDRKGSGGQPLEVDAGVNPAVLNK